MAERLTSNEIAKLLGTVTPKQLADVERVIDQCLQIAEQVFPLNSDRSYERPTVKFDLKGTTAGQAWRAKIRLNSELLHNPEHYDEMIAQTLPHEIAHCVVIQKWGHAAQSHGYEWKAVMQAFGLRADRTHSMPVTKARKHKKYSYECKGCDRKTTFGATVLRRLREGKKYRCGYCGTPIPRDLS